MSDLDLLTFTPLYADQDENVILARWREWANEGLDPVEDTEEWTDTREGSMWWITTTPGRREAARMYDLMGTEVVASVFPQWSWGEYLDDHAELRDIGRLIATPAAGTVVFTGEDGTVIPAGTTVSLEPTEEDEDEDVPEYETDLTVTIAAVTAAVGVTATEPGSLGNVAANAVIALPNDVDGVVSLTNPAPTEGGTDVEADFNLRDRVLESFVGVAVANQLYYRRIALSEPGISRATVVPAGNGPGTIVIIVATADGDPASPAAVASLQDRLDPEAGQGAGDGQVGATITVLTATTQDVEVAGTIEFEPGYALNAGGGLIALRDPIIAAIAAYIDGVEPGEEIVRQQLISRIMRIRGVHDVANVLLNGAAENVQIPATPPKTPTLGSTAGIIEGVV